MAAIAARLRCPAPGWVPSTTSSHPPEFQRGVPERPAPSPAHPASTLLTQHSTARLIRLQKSRFIKTSRSEVVVLDLGESGDSGEQGAAGTTLYSIPSERPRTGRSVLGQSGGSRGAASQGQETLIFIRECLLLPGGISGDLVIDSSNSLDRVRPRAML
ncbi:unnamed protein product [Lota lota]